jgi:transposase
VAALPCWTPWPLIEICARSLFTELQAGPSTGHDLGRRERERVAGKTLWVGIDVGKTSHHACVVDADGKTVFSRKVKNRQGAIEELITRARTRAAQGSGSGDVVWALDMNSGSAALLVTLLAATGQRLLSVPGRLVNRMAGAFAGEGKTDAKDARTIAQTARLRGDLTEITLPDRIVGDLQVLTARRADLMADWVRGVNRLRELLGAIFPGLEEAFDYSTRSALILLTGFQTPTGLRAAGVDSVAQFLRAQQAWAPGILAMAAAAVTVAGEQTVVLPREAVTAPMIARLAGQLLDLDRELKDLDKQLSARFGEHPARRDHHQHRWVRAGSWRGTARPHRWRTCSPRSAPRTDWLPTPASPRSPVTRAACRATCAVQSATTAHCAECSTWPHCRR